MSKGGCLSLLTVAAAALVCLAVAENDDGRRQDILATLPRHTNYKAVHKLEGHKVTLKCQLFDGSEWSKCVWKHNHNTAVISRGPNGHSYMEPYDPESDRVIVNSDFNECNLVIKKVNRTLDEGNWYCNLTKDVVVGDHLVPSMGGDSSPATETAVGTAQSWYEVTMYRLKVARKTTMQISGPKDKQIRLGVPQRFDCSVSNGQLNPISVFVIRNGTVVRNNTFQPHETNISADNVQRAVFEYTSTINDTYGDSFISCMTEVESLDPRDGHHHQRAGHHNINRQPRRRHAKQRLLKTVALPEIRFQPVLMESSPDLRRMRLRCMDGEGPQPTTRTLVFRSNPLPDLKLLITNTNDHVYSEDQVDFKVSDIDGYEVSVTVDLNGVKDLKQASLQASNEVGSYTVELLCPPKDAETSCSFFHVLSCPNSTAYSQMATTVGLVLVLVMFLLAVCLCCYFSRKRRGLCQKMLGIQDGSDGEKLNTPHRIFIEDANRSGVSSGSGSTDASGRVIVNPSHPFENTTIVAKINFGPRGSALLQGPNPAFSNSNSGLDHVYSEISDEFRSASSCHSSSGGANTTTADRDPITETTILRTSSCLDESEGEGDSVSSLGAEDPTPSTFIPKQPSQSNYLQATTTATINPRGVGGYTFNPFKCDSGIDKTSPDPPVQLRRPRPPQNKKKQPHAAPPPAAAKPPMPNYSRHSSTSSEQELDVSFNITYDKLDFDRARQTLRPHYQSTETLKSFKYSTNI